MQPAQQQGRFFPSNNSAQVRSMRRCRVVGCFASSTQQKNSFRPSGVKLSHSIKTFGFDRTALEGLHVLRGQCLGEKRSPRDLAPTPRTATSYAAMPPKANEPDEQFSEAEAARRRDELAKRILRMPPQPRKPSPSKLARATAKPAKKKG